MKLTILSEKLIGEELAVPIYNDSGIMIMNCNVPLSERGVNTLKRMGMFIIYINDNNDDITLQEIIDLPTRIKITKMLKTEFDNIKAKKIINDSVIYGIVDEIIKNINLSENAFLHNNVVQADESMQLVNHSITTAIFSIVIGINKKYDTKKIFNLGVGALLHDIGKLISEGNKHTEEGYKLLKGNHIISPTAIICALQHHENFDGTGYPHKIKGDKIFEFTKIVSIVDQYINAQANGDNLLPHEIVENISALASIKFDSEFVKDFINSIYCYPNGLQIRLNNGKKAIIVMQNKNYPLRPIIMIEDNNSDTGEKTIINLLENLTLFVEEVIY